MKLTPSSIILGTLLSFTVLPAMAKQSGIEEMPIAGNDNQPGLSMKDMKHGHDHGKKGAMNHGTEKKGGMKHGEKKKDGMGHDKKKGMKKHHKKMKMKLDRINERLEIIETQLQQLLNRSH